MKWEYRKAGEKNFVNKRALMQCDVYTTVFLVASVPRKSACSNLHAHSI